jgi:hypothetical protein
MSVGVRQQGSYVVRMHIYYKMPNDPTLIFYTPASIIAGKSKHHKHQQGTINDNSYISRPVIIRHEVHIFYRQTDSLPIDEICLFRTRIDTGKFTEYRSITRVMYC